MGKPFNTARWLFIAALGAVFGSCGGGAGECSEGTEMCPCINGFQCDVGLECRSGYCVSPFGNTSATATATATASGGGTDSNTTGGSETTAGSGGSDSDTGGGGGQFCVEECSADADCLIGGADQGFACEGGHCLGGSTGGCAGDAECVALWSGWATSCTSTDQCSGQVCIEDSEGNGWCATQPSEFIDCATLDMEEILMPAYDGSGDVPVCARPNAFCEDEVCLNPCADDSGCANYIGHPACNQGSGRCECVSDSDCANSGQPGWSVCNNGVCGCGSDDDCAGTANADTCYDGVCGCSSVDVCTNEPVFDGTSVACGTY